MKPVNVLAALVVLARARAESCSFEGYDFSTEFGSTTYNVTDSNSYGWRAQVTPCGAGACDAFKKGVAVKMSQLGQCNSVIARYDRGEWSWTNGEDASEGIQAQYSNGDICTTNQQHVAVLKFVCKESDDQVPTGHTDSTQGCAWEFVIPTETLCSGSHSGLSPGWIFTIIVLVTFIVYFMVGCVYSWRSKGTALGLESVPNRRFWTELPSLVQEGCWFTWGTIRGNRYKEIGSGADETF